MFEALVWAVIVALLEVVLCVLIFWHGGEHVSTLFLGGGVGNDAIGVVVAMFSIFCFPGFAFAAALIARFASPKFVSWRFPRTDTSARAR